MKVALVHDWLTGMRGGEKVLEVLCELYPEADILTLVHERGSVSPKIERHNIITSALQPFPWIRRNYRYFLPVFPVLIEQFDLDAYDLIISSSHSTAKAVVKTGKSIHISYCHSPMRYAWDQFDAYFGPARVGSRLSHWFYRPIMRYLATWDAATATRVDRFIANSQHISQRISRYYNRDATVVHPPVDTDFYHPNQTIPGSHFLIVSALVPYKKIELAIKASQQIGAQLRIIGDGPDRQRLVRYAGSQVEFLGQVSDEILRDEYRCAAAVLMPGKEDFGIVPVEAQACGRPVVALASGGVLETIIDGHTGVLVQGSTADDFAKGMERVRSQSFNLELIRSHAEKFSRERFLEQMKNIINNTINHSSEIQW